MGYLDNEYLHIKPMQKFKAGATSFAPAYRFWRNQLFSFVNRIFTWELPAELPQKEIEVRLIMHGFCGLIVENSKLLAVDATLYGITDYYDEFTDFNYATPLRNGSRKIGVNGVIVANNQLRNDMYHLIHRYAVMLAHTEVSLINVLVIGRSNNTAIASSEKSAASVREYYDKLYNGKLDAIVDTAFLGVNFQQNTGSQPLTVKDLVDTRNNILTNFYEDIGVKKAAAKKEREVVDEVSASDGLLKLNLRDMYDMRLKACEDVKNVFGIDINCNCNIDYNDDGLPEVEEGGAEDEAEAAL